jgi:hypothetical protein
MDVEESQRLKKRMEIAVAHIMQSTVIDRDLKNAMVLKVLTDTFVVCCRQK